MKKLILALLLTLGVTTFAYAGNTEPTTLIEYSGSNPIYIGKAMPGTATSAAYWQIKKLTYSGDNVTNIEWALGNSKFTHVWDNRASINFR